ncbi:hypothetical protein ABD76_10720 [Paenibacillus dendritiformis]|uniref:Imm49 family immunity protein n=1 Tax=Paenibacillus dendritiformis TaxID=130049 RepID=UPI0018CDAE77|nr:Imm49 family immunity protein [Paenibacillus dendritiformis]MBG9792936.1 hypothetical protein [Paenibacillus dendritiformis]
MANSRYLQYFPEIFNETIEDTNDRIQRYRENGLPKNVGYYYELLADGFQDIAIGEIVLNGDAIKSKQNFFLAGKMQEVLYKKYDEKQNGISSDYITTDKYTRLLMALISDHEKLIVSLAELFGGRTEEEEEDHELHKSVGYAVKYILLGDRQKAKEYVQVLKKLEGQKSMKLYNGYQQVLNGIIENDNNQVNEGLKYMIECHKKLKDDYGDTPQELLAIPVLGLAKLAIRNGIEVNIDDAISPKILLQKHDISYTNVDFVD